MAMEIWTEWDPLQSIVVGDCPTECNFVDIVDEHSKKLLDKILRETKEDLDHLSETLKKLGVKVYRPKLLRYKDKISIPDFEITNPIYPLISRDQYLVYGKTIYQSYTSLPDRYFDGLSYYEVFKDLYESGFNWISQPPPILENLTSDSWWVNGPQQYQRLKNKILWHAATFFKCGDSIIVNDRGPGTSLGLEWYKRNIDGNIIINQGTSCESFGHIDHGFFMTDDDTVVGLENWIPHCLRNKKTIIIDQLITPAPIEEIINAKQKFENRYSYDWLSQWLNEWRGYAQDVCFDTNILVVDKNTLIFSNHQPHLFEELKKINIQCLVCPLRHGGFWESGIHCLTLDLVRIGNKRSIIRN